MTREEPYRSASSQARRARLDPQVGKVLQSARRTESSQDAAGASGQARGTVLSGASTAGVLATGA
jgi:hypothetical protein